MKKLNGSPDWNAVDVDDLLVGVSKVYRYYTAK